MIFKIAYLLLKGENQMLKKISSFMSIIFFVMLIMFADTAKEGTLNGLNLAFRTAIPALFPFFVASTLLSQTGAITILSKVFSPIMHRVYGLPSECAGVLVLGFTGGYPVGVSATCELYKAKQIDKLQAERLLGFCNNTGPAFIVGVCGVGILGSVKLGLILYFIHIVSALICGKFFSLKGYKTQSYNKSIKKFDFATALVNGCEQAAQTSIKVAGFLTFFSVLIALLRTINLNLPDICYPIIYSFLELTCGLMILHEVYIPTHILMSIMSAMLAFGGLSVICQAFSIVKPMDISFKNCVIGKILHTIVAFTLTLIVTRFIPVCVPTMAGYMYMPMISKKYVLIMCIFILYIFTTSKQSKNTL